MSASITAPRGLQTLNPSPEISRYYNKVDAPYINTAQVLSEVLLPVRYPGQTFLVVDEEWWFKSGKLDADLVLKQDSGTGITDLDYTPSPTQGTVTSSTGTDAIISLADNTNAGLMSPSDKETLYDNVIYRSGTEVGKPVTGDVEIGDGISLVTEELGGIKSLLTSKGGKWQIQIIDGIDNPVFYFDERRGFIADRLFNIENDENAYIQKGHIVQLEEGVFNLELANTGDETTASIQAKRPLKTVNGSSLEGTGDIVVGGAVDSVNGKTGVVVLTASDVGAPSGSGNSTGTNTGDNSTNTNSNAYADSKVADAIVDGVANVAPSQNAVFDALTLKQATLTDINFGTFTNSVENKETQANTDILGYIDVTSGKLVKQTFSKLVDYLKGFFQTSRIIVTSNVIAVNGSVYHNNGNNTFTDPTPENNKGFYVLNVAGSPTIGGNAQSVGTYLFRYYDGANWINNTIKKGVSNAVYSANKTLTPIDNNDTIFMDSGTLTVNPTAQAYQNGYTIAVASSGGSNTPLVLQSSTDWSYVINANGSIASGSVFIEKGGTATIVRKANLKIFQINGSVI